MKLVVNCCDPTCLEGKGEVTAPWEHIPDCYLLETECECAEIEAIEGVDSAHPEDLEFHEIASQPITWAGPNTDILSDDNWGLAAVTSPVPLQGPFPQTWTYNQTKTGAGTIAYQIDGTAGEIPQLAGRLTTFYTAHPSAGPGDHGTAVATFIAGTRDGMARDALVRNSVATGANGSATLSQITSAFNAVIGDYAGRTEFAMVNVSIAGSAGSDPLAAAVAAARNAGLLVVAGSGNDGRDIGVSPVWPAANPYVLTVGAIDWTETIISISNWGAPVDLYAPGYDMNVDGWTRRSTFAGGTSFACPYPMAIGLLIGEGRARLDAAGVDALKAEIIGMGKPGRVITPTGLAPVAHIPGVSTPSPSGAQIRVSIIA